MVLVRSSLRVRLPGIDETRPPLPGARLAGAGPAGLAQDRVERTDRILDRRRDRVTCAGQLPADAGS